MVLSMWIHQNGPLEGAAAHTQRVQVVSSLAAVSVHEFVTAVSLICCFACILESTEFETVYN